VSGASLEYLLKQRIIDPRNDPLAAGGWSTKQDAVDSLMAELVSEQAGPGASAHGSTPSQQIPGLTVPTPAGVGDVVPFRDAWSELLDALQRLAAKDRMDFRIERTSGTALQFLAETIGEDKTKTANYPGSPYVTLSADLGTLKLPRLTEDWREEKTVVYLLCRGAGDNREFYGSLASNWSETAYSYAAVVKDVREAENATEYIEQAEQELFNHRAKQSFSFETERPGELYRDVWDLGDFVTVTWGDYEADMRIVSVIVDVLDDGEKVKVAVRKRYE